MHGASIDNGDGFNVNSLAASLASLHRSPTRPLQSAVAPSQQTRHARRIYVGGLPEATEREIGEFFSDVARRTMLRPPAGNPVLSVYINGERKFAFVELNTIELANGMMSLDNIIFKGVPLKLRRPNDYNPLLLTLEQREKAEPLNTAGIQIGGGGAGAAGGGGGSAAGAPGAPGTRDSPYRIFLGGLPVALGEPELRELLGAFGPLIVLQVARGPDGSHKGYGFAEFADPAVTDIAIAALHGLAIGDRSITVSRTKSGQGAGAGGGRSGGSAPPSMMPPPSGDGGYGGGGSSSAPSGIPSRVVLLDGMVGPSELADDNEYRDVVEDITAETGRYGALLGVNVPRGGPAAGRVFIQYADVMGAIAGATSLAGRQFGGRPIHARYYDEGAFAQGLLDR